MVAPAIIAAGITAAPAVASLFGKKKKTSQVPLETPEQRAARQALLGFSQTGQFGDFQAGSEVPLGYGDFGATGIEQTGLSNLQNLLQSGIPDQFRMGDQALQDLLQTSPQAIQSQFDPFKTQVERQIRDSNTALKRGAGFAGNLYSTNTIRGLGDIQARGNETLTAQLANLTNEALNRRLQAIPLAYQSGQAQEGINLGRINASQQYGDLTRQLNDASIKARDAELLRRRQELQLPIQAAQTVAGGAPPFGIPDIKTSPFDDILGLAGQIGGNYLGNELFANQYKRNFPGADNMANSPGGSPTRFGLPPSLSFLPQYGYGRA